MRVATTSFVMLLLFVLAAVSANPPPHLVFVMVDDLGYNDVGYHDHRVLTPTLDKLAREGVLLERHYVYRYGVKATIRSL